MLVVISYDIQDDRVRNRLAKRLLDFGPRVQFSVFEADISRKELAQLTKMLSRVQLAENDSIRLYRVCDECIKNIRIWGKGEITRDKDFYIV